MACTRLPFFASFLQSLKAVVSFLRSEDNARILQVPHTQTSFAKWRWHTLCACCSEVDRASAAQASWNPGPFRRMKDAELFKLVSEAL
eukprot:13034178-Alexandrium_andersonii.AAC.1